MGLKVRRLQVESGKYGRFGLKSDQDGIESDNFRYMLRQSLLLKSDQDGIESHQHQCKGEEECELKSDQDGIER